MKKIKVLHYYNVMNRGGAETFIINVFRKIDKTEIEFNFLVSSNEKGDYDDEILKLGGKIYHIEKPNKKKPISAYKNLKNFFKQNNDIDVIHLPVSFYSGFIAMVAKKCGIRKVIVHSHISKINFNENVLKNIFKKIYIFIMKKLINKYTDIKIACGEEAGKLLFGSLKNVIILNNGIDVDNYSYNSKSKLLKKEFGLKNEFIIGNVARFSLVKNQSFFIELAKYIKDNNIDAKIILVGDGEMRNTVERNTVENNLSDIIIFAGLRKNINDFMNLFDVFVMPSLCEGFPVTIIESIASGTPCVLSSGIPKETAIVDYMVSFESLDSPVKLWWKKIDSYKDFSPDINNINKLLKEKHFDSYSVTKKLEEIYKK